MKRNNSKKKSSEDEEDEMVTDDAINKAYAALGLESSNDDDLLNKGEDDDDDEEEIESDEEEETEEESEEETEEDDEEEVVKAKTTSKKTVPAKKVIQKSVTSKKGDDTFQKAIDTISTNQDNMAKALGTIMKGMAQEIQTLRADLLDRVEGVESAIEEKIESFGETPNARKSTARPLSKVFSKGFGEDESAGGSQGALSMRQNKKQILSIMDSIAYKGENIVDEDMAKGVALFESTGNMPGDLIARLKHERGITVVN